MARTVLPVTSVGRSGVTHPAEQSGDTTNNHVVANTGRTIILVRNADTSSHSVTFVITNTVDGQAVTNRTVAVPASSTVDLGKFQTEIYGSQMGINVDSAQLKLIALEP
jgi:hypothetical protein